MSIDCLKREPLGDISAHIIGSGRSHLELLDVLGQLPVGRVLDIPCGTGVLSKWLIEKGWTVHCADIDRGNFMLGDAVPFSEVDLNRRLPFDDGVFDCVVCANGLHRVFYARGAIAEFARILRPGGTLVLNLNNYYSLVNRLRVLVCGSPSYIFDEEFFEQTIQAAEAQVRIAYPFSQIANYLSLAHLEIVSMHTADRLRRHKIAAFLGVPLRWISLFCLRFTRRPDLLRWNANTAIFSGGAYVVALARKNG